MIKAASTKYTRFYKVMLILSTIGTSIGAIGLFGIPQLIAQFHLAPLYHAAMLANVVVTLVSIVALYLLWQKRIEGYRLKIGTYIAALVIEIAAIVTAHPYLTYVIERSAASVSSSTELSAAELALVNDILFAMYYIGLSFSIVITIVFMLLWMKAWNIQAAADSDK